MTSSEWDDYAGDWDGNEEVRTYADYAFFVQWDWMEQMPAEKIESAFKAAGLSAYAIEEAFVMEAADQSAQVKIGLGQFEGEIA